jgi:ABC-type sulfate transport system substrate-binding protein
VTTLFTAADLGGWPTIETTFFASGGVWDRLAAAGKR